MYLKCASNFLKVTSLIQAIHYDGTVYESQLCQSKFKHCAFVYCLSSAMLNLTYWLFSARPVKLIENNHTACCVSFVLNILYVTHLNDLIYLCKYSI